MALAGGKFARVFLRWRARVWVELLLKQGGLATNPKNETNKPVNNADSPDVPFSPR